MAEKDEQGSALTEAYQGAPGWTRQVTAHYTCASCGFLFGAPFYVAINVASDPELSHLLSCGELNTVTCPACAAAAAASLPLIYHDPKAMRFALLLPEGLRHRELEERARLLGELAGDPSPIPDYVRQAEVVFGTTGLLRLLDETLEALTPKQAVVDEAARQRALIEEREVAVERRETEALAREEDLLSKQEELAVARTRLEQEQSRLAAQWAALEREKETLRALSLELERRERRERAEAAEDPSAKTQPTIPGPGAAESALLEGRPRDAVDRFRAGEEPTRHLLHEDRVFLLARLGAERLQAFREAAPTLLVQLFHLPPSPLMILVLLPGGESGGKGSDLAALAERAIYFFLDPGSAADRALIERLGQECLLYLDIYDDESRPATSWEIQAPLSENVRHLAVLAQEALPRSEELLRSFPEAVVTYQKLGAERLGHMQHNFRADSFQEMATPAAARLALGIVSYWSEPENQRYLITVKSFPLIYWRSIRERVVRRASEFGLHLVEPLKAFAIEQKIVASRQELLRAAVSSFAEVSLRLKASDLDAVQEWENWRLLLQDCVREGVPIDQQIEELAAAAAKRAGKPEDEAAPGGDLSLLADQALLPLLQSRDLRLDAALELCERGATGALEPLYTAVCSMTRSEVARVLPALIAMGEVAVPFLLQGVRHRKSFLRQGCALALGALRSAAGVEPLMEMLLTEPTNVWREAARALGDMGSVALGALIAGQRTADGNGRERIAWALAQASLKSEMGEEVAAMARGKDLRLARVANRSLELQEQVKQNDDEVRGGKPLRDQTIVRAFSRRFFENLRQGERELGEGDIVEQEEVLDDTDIVDEEVEVQDDDILVPR